ncbi:DUF4280 domain-containing protein [Coleofasciculus chthonoplastes]|uniref:DUF4280 domain-containing protein n=1 Tax=Coleofasciculus chthonoplastes TaxID=64178 RepID=UPI0032F5C6A7
MARQVCSGAILECSLGSNPSVLTVPPDYRVFAINPAANIQDNKPGVNFPPFGVCVNIGGPCVPVTPNPWKLGGKPVKIGSGAILTLTEADTLICQFGGVIKVIDPGQSCVCIDQSAKSVAIKPFTVQCSGNKITLIPKKTNGKTLYFFFGYKNSKTDNKMRDKEVPYLEDDVYRSAAQGFKVVYDKAGNYKDFFDAIYDPNCYGIYWSGHGSNGNIQSSDGKWIRPEAVNPNRVSPNIAYLILATCNSGRGAKRWQTIIGTQCQFEGWVYLTDTSETIDFTSDAWFDWFDSLIPHGGSNPNKELVDYINDAKKAK